MAIGNAKSPELRKSYSNEKNLIFSEKVRARRLELGLKQSDLAKMLSWKQSQVSGLEGGRFVDDAERVIAIAKALETTPNYLFGFTDEP